jgi:hypothetical protein
VRERGLLHCVLDWVSDKPPSGKSKEPLNVRYYRMWLDEEESSSSSSDEEEEDAEEEEEEEEEVQGGDDEVVEVDSEVEEVSPTVVIPVPVPAPAPVSRMRKKITSPDADARQPTTKKHKTNTVEVEPPSEPGPSEPGPSSPGPSPLPPVRTTSLRQKALSVISGVFNKFGFGSGQAPSPAAAVTTAAAASPTPPALTERQARLAYYAAKRRREQIERDLARLERALHPPHTDQSLRMRLLVCAMA